MCKVKKYLWLLLTLFITKSVYAANITVKDCEYTDEYIKWLNQSESVKKNFVMPTMCKDDNLKKYNIVGTNSKLQDVSIENSNFNLKTYELVTDIKDQQDTEACWAFATNSSIESNLLMNNKGTYDLSEAHMDLATQSKYNNNRNTFNRAKNSGGNYLISSAYIMNSWGPILESDLPFDKLVKYNDEEDTAENHIYASDVINRKAVLDVNSITFLGNTGSCTQNTIKDIKEYLISNGALATYIYLPKENKNIQYLYYNGEELVNHGVSIVGWDDNISVDNFTEDKPTSNGAWIVKNSYGGNEYQYVSYEDVHVCNNVVGFFDIDNEVEDNTYYYDNLGGNTTSSVSTNELYLVSVFNKKSIKRNEELKEVAMYFSKVGQKYEIYFANGEAYNIEGAKKVGEGTTNFVGYKTIKLSNPEIINNDKFTIIVKLTDSENIKFEVSKKKQGVEVYDSMKFTKGVQFISTDGINYSDTTNNEDGSFHLTIRAYTNSLEFISNNTNDESTNNVPNESNVNVNTENNINNLTITGDDNRVDTPTENKQTGYYIPSILILIVIPIIFIIKKLKKKKIYNI